MEMDKDKRKSSLAILIGKPSKMDEEEMEEESEEEEDEEMGLDVAAEEILDAVATGDKDSLKTALKSFVRQCY